MKKCIIHEINKDFVYPIENTASNEIIHVHNETYMHLI